MCGIYDSHQSRLSALQEQRHDDWRLVEDALASRLGVATVAAEALERFRHAQSADAAAFRIYRVEPDGSRAQGPTVSAEFVKEYIYVKPDTGEVSLRDLHFDTPRGESPAGVRPLGRFLVALNGTDDTDTDPAEHYLEHVAQHVREALVETCEDWLQNPFGFEGQFLARIDANDDQRRRFRLMLARVRDPQGPVDPGIVEACRYDAAMPAAFRRAFDETYHDMEVAERTTYAALYETKFSAINTIAEDIRARMVALGLYPDVDDLSDYVRLYEARIEAREKNYAALEAAREAHALQMELERYRHGTSLERLAAEWAARLEGKRIDLEGIELRGLIDERLGRLDFDARMEKIEADLEAARMRIAADERIAQRQAEVTRWVEAKKARVGILKSVIDGVFRVGAASASPE